MKKDILVIAHFCGDFNGEENNRFNYLVDLLIDRDYNVELVTSDFSHNKKMKRDKIQENYNYKVTFISEPGYSKNVSFKRFYSHYIMGKNLERYLRSRKKPDVIYCAVPSLDVAGVAAKYAKKDNIRFIIDIQDLWPEAFKLLLNVPLISDLLFYPIQKKANYIYSMADEIVAVSKTYANRAFMVNNKCKRVREVFLGTELAQFDRLSEINKFISKPEDEIWLVYIGTLGHSYDITCVIDALKVLKDKGIKNLKFIVIGDGPLKDKFENYAKKEDILVQFTGRLDYGKMVGILKVCDIAVNPICHGAAQSIINKHGDYAAAGLPVLNTQESEEYRNLVDEFQMGFNCKNNDAQDLAEKMLRLYDNEDLRRNMGSNSRRLAENKFDRKVTYQNILELFDENLYK